MNLGSYTNAQKLIQFQCQKIGLIVRFKMRVFYNPKQFNNNGFKFSQTEAAEGFRAKCITFGLLHAEPLKNTF